MKRLLIASILLIALSIISAHAAMYQWVDENGIKHFSNTAPPAKVEIEKKPEVESKYAPPPKTSVSPSTAVSNYKKALLKKQSTYKYKKSASTPSKSTSSSNSNSSDYYKSLMEKYEKRVENCKQDLNDVKRESYKDLKRHKKRVDKREEWLADAKRNFEYYKNKYNNSK